MSVHRACDAQEWQDSGGVAGVAAQGGGDVAVAHGGQDADGEVAQAGHDSWGGAGAGLGGVLGEGGVADVVQRLDAPVALDSVGQAGGVGLGGSESGDRVHGHGAPAPVGERPDPAGDADRLGGVGESRPGTVVTWRRWVSTLHGCGRGCGLRRGCHATARW